jgi:hypothetical protein
MKYVRFLHLKQSIARMAHLPGNSFPGTNNLSTPDSVMTAIRITPPEDPSRAMAKDKAL